MKVRIRKITNNNFENRSALLRVNLMNRYSIMKAKRNTAQVRLYNLQHLSSNATKYY
jgi:hypothetical protein